MTATDSNAFRVEVAVPSFVPAVGHYANVSTNTLSSVDPCPAGNCSYSGSTKQNSVYVAWGGGVFIPWWGVAGGLLLHNAGHNDYWGNEVYIYDAWTRAFIRLTNPSSYGENMHESHPANLSNANFWPDGTPGMSHHYQGYQALAPADGGGDKGSLLRFGWGAEAAGLNNVMKFDIDALTWSQFADLSSVGGDRHLATAFDSSRGRYWFHAGYDADNTGVGYLTTGGSLTQITPGVHQESPDHVMSYYPAGDLIMHLCIVSAGVRLYGRPAGAGSGTSWTQLTTSGAALGDCNDGLEWSTILGCFVQLLSGTNQVRRIQPPASNPLSNTWVITTETLTADAGASPPQDSVDNGTGHWCRFREAPVLKSFVYSDGRSNPAQLYRLSGMT